MNQSYRKYFEDVQRWIGINCMTVLVSVQIILIVVIVIDIVLLLVFMMTSSNGNIFRVTGLFVRGIHRSPVNSPHKGQWRGALMFSLICAWINRWVNNREAGNLRRHQAHYDVIVMYVIAIALIFIIKLHFCRYCHHYFYFNAIVYNINVAIWNITMIIARRKRRRRRLTL